MDNMGNDNMGNDLKLLHCLDIIKIIVSKIAPLAHKTIIGTAPNYLQLEFFRYAHNLNLSFLMWPLHRRNIQEARHKTVKLSVVFTQRVPRLRVLVSVELFWKFQKLSTVLSPWNFL